MSPAERLADLRAKLGAKPAGTPQPETPEEAAERAETREVMRALQARVLWRED